MAVNKHNMLTAEILSPLDVYGVQDTQPSLLRVLWRRKWIIVLAVVLAAAAGVAYLQLVPREYTGTVLLYVEPDKPRMIEADEGYNPGRRSEPFMQVQMITSDEVLAGAMKDAAVAQCRTLQARDPMSTLRNAVSCQITDKNEVLSLTVSGPYKDDVAPLANAVTRSYIDYRAMHQRGGAEAMLAILDREKQKLDSDRQAIGQKMVKFKHDNATLSFNIDKGNIVLDRLATLSAAMTTAELESITAKADYDAASAVVKQGGSIQQMLQAQQLSDSAHWNTNEETQLRQTLSQLRLKLATLQSTCSDEAPAVVSLKRRVQEIQAQLSQREERLGNNYLAAAQQRRDTTRAKTDEMRAACLNQQRLAEAVDLKSAQFAMLEADLKRADRLADVIDGRIKELMLSKDLGGRDVVVLQAAQTPSGPSKPNRAIVLGAAPMVGLLLGLALAMLRDRGDTRIRSGAEAVSAVAAPVLGAVPHMPNSRKLPRAGRHLEGQPFSAASEAYRAIRTSLVLNHSNGSALSILVTSPADGEGKSTVTANLGIALAQMGYRTLIVDADLRKPVQHEIFDISGSPGLAGVLASGEKAGEFVRPTTLPNLDLLAAGLWKRHPVDLMDAKALADMIDELGRTYRYILFDSPAALPLADTRALAYLCEATILVLRADSSDRRLAWQARQALQASGATMIGTILNDVRGDWTRWSGTPAPKDSLPALAAPSTTQKNLTLSKVS